MSCECNCGQKTMVEEYPEKRIQLEEYISTLELTEDKAKNRGFLIQTLHKAQEIFGYLPLDLQHFVADNGNEKMLNSRLP